MFLIKLLLNNWNNCFKWRMIKERSGSFKTTTLQITRNVGLEGTKMKESFRFAPFQKVSLLVQITGNSPYGSYFNFSKQK